VRSIRLFGLFDIGALMMQVLAVALRAAESQVKFFTDRPGERRARRESSLAKPCAAVFCLTCRQPTA
jgi:hypothetical protein